MQEFSSQSSQILTFLYTDIEGSTRLWEQFPESVESAVSRHDRILRNAVDKYGGSVFRTVGDGVCAVFVNASNAVAAALDAQIALKAEAWGEIQALKVRMAIHTGEVEAYGNDYTGGSLNRIGRLLSVTHGGQVILSQATQLLVRDALPPRVGLADLGEIRLRDLSHPEQVFQLTHPDLPGDFPPLASLDRQPNNLPSQPTPLIGRETELAEILNRVRSDTVRMLTLTGPGGTGKTRLGLHAAADLVGHFEHGVFFVDLAPIRAPEAVLPAIARAIGVRETSYRPLMDELKEQLQDREMLLLLDNMEQVTEAAPYLVELLQDCPWLKFLITSREPLHVRAEHIFAVPPLTLPASDLKHRSIEKLTQYEAVRLFIERAQAVKPDFQVTNENAPAVAEICIRLDGLPLAIELAASRIKLFSPQALLERLENRLRLLSGGARDLPLRHQTLRDTISWSYELLDEDVQRLFELISVFPSGGTFESIEAVTGMVEGLNVDTLDGLASLVDKSLVRQTSMKDAEPRFVMLETIREYATERLHENANFHSDTLRAHASYFADYTQRQWEQISRAREQALQNLATEVENLRAAWRYWVAEGDLGQLGKFIDSLWLLFDSRGWYHAMIDLTTDLLNVLTSTPSTPERAQQEIVLQTSLASALLATKGYLSDDVERAYTRALQLIEEQGEIPQLFPVLRGLSRYYGYRGEVEKAIRMGEYTLKIADQLNDADMKVVGHLTLGTNYSLYEDLTRGLEHFEQGIANYEPNRLSTKRFRFGTDPGVACYITSALTLLMLGFPDQALKRAVDTVRLARQLNHPFSMAYTLFHTGLIHLWTREFEQAEQFSHELNALAEEYDFQVWKAVGSCLHGSALAGLGRGERGLEQISWGMDVYQELKSPPTFWPLLVLNQAQAYLHTGKAQEGLDRLDRILESTGKSRGEVFICEIYRLKGDLLLDVSRENAAEAEQYYQKAAELAQKQKARMLALRVATSLARLWGSQGKLEQGRQVLGDIYASMTEGFNTADMREAREILGIN